MAPPLLAWRRRHARKSTLCSKAMEGALPWLVIHGDTLWRVALPLLVVAGAIAARTAPRIRAAWAASWARRTVRRAVAVATDLREGPAILVGRIEARAELRPEAEVIAGEPAVAVTILRRARAREEGALGFAAEGLAVSVGDVRIELEGEPEILVGSRQTTRERLSRARPELRAALIEVDDDAALAVSAADPEIRVCSLAAGDRVLCEGELRCEHRPEEAHGYREAAARWVLGPTQRGDRARVRLVSLSRPVLRGEHGRGLALLGGALLGLALFAVVFGIGGEIALHLEKRALAQLLASQGELPRAGELWSAQIAAATPLRRREAIDRLAAALAAARQHHDPALPRELAALSKLGGDCEQVIEALLAHGQQELAEEVPCPRKPALVRKAVAWFERGEFDAASRLFTWASRRDPDSREILAHLLAGRLDVAADAARAALRSEEDPRRRRSLACIADWLDLKRTDAPAASEHIEEQAYRRPEGDGCGLLFADLLLDRGTRADYLKTLPTDEAPSLPGGRALRLLLSGECLRPVDPGELWARRIEPAWLLYGRQERRLLQFAPSMLLAHGVGRNPLAPDAFGEQQAEEAAFAASAIGNHALALHFLQRVPANADKNGWLGAAVHARSREAKHRISFPRDSTAPPPTAGLWSFWTRRGGDGAVLASLLDRTPLEADHAYLLAGAVRGGEDDLKQWLAWGPRGTLSVTWVGLVAELENRRLFAAALGDDKTVAELEATLARHRAALLRREIAVPVALLEALSLERGQR